MLNLELAHRSDNRIRTMRQLNGFDGHMGEVLPACNA
jgi:hypothetical protein